MAATLLTPQTQAAPYAYTAPKAIKLTLGDHTNTNTFQCTGRERVLFYNPNTGTSDVWTFATSAASAGTFTLTVQINGVVLGTTAPIAFNAPAATVATAVLAVISPSYPDATVTGSGTAPNSTGTILTFAGSIKGMPITLTHTDGGLTGGTIDTFTHTTTGSGAYVVTVNGAPDEEGRTRNWSYFLGAGVMVTTQRFPQEGWADAVTGLVTLDPGDNTVDVAVLRDPQ